MMSQIWNLREEPISHLAFPFGAKEINYKFGEFSVENLLWYKFIYQMKELPWTNVFLILVPLQLKECFDVC